MSIAKALRLQADVTRILATTPASPPVSDRPVLVLPVGLPGSGKSTFCRRLARECGLVVLESDALRRLLFEKPRHSKRESSALFAALHEAARVLLRAGASVIIDATSLQESDRRPVYALAADTGAQLLLLHFSAAEAIIADRLRRLAAGEDPEDRSTAGFGVYRAMSGRAEPLLREHFRVDTSDPASAESAYARVVERCRPVISGSNTRGGVS